MKKVYVLRHAEKDAAGEITENGKRLAKQLGKTLPTFAMVISSESPRAIVTATSITGREPATDDRAGFYNTTQEVSDDINKLATERSIGFFEAADAYNGGELREGMNAQAVELNNLIDDTLARLNDGETALVVSHDMTIAPAMALRGQPRHSVDFLSGYIIADGGALSAFDAQQASI